MTDPAVLLGLLATALLVCSLVAASPRRRSLPSHPLPVLPRDWSLPSLLSLLQLTPFDRLSPSAQRGVVEGLRAADRGPVSMREHGRINLVLGEIALSAGDREEARLRFRAALRWDPSLPIRRTVERLEHPTPLSFTCRRAA